MIKKYYQVNLQILFHLLYLKFKMNYKNHYKSIIDIAISFLGFTILSPIFFIVVVLLFIVNRGKVLFIQKRPGLNESTFKIIKFKTMNDKKDKNRQLLPDEMRMTKVGSIVRKLSLDELPQLLNVIKGDMSLIGPRPLLPEYLPLYNDFQKRRHEVKPGITGWAQVNGRNAISWEDKFEYDVWYVDNISFKTDIKVLVLTLIKVLKSEGISSKSSETMEKFTG